MKPKPQKPRENSLEYEFQAAWAPISKKGDRDATRNVGFTVHSTGE